MPELPIEIKELRNQKASLLNMINDAAKAFVNGSESPLTALTDPAIQPMIENLYKLKEQLADFLDAVEHYMHSTGADIPAALDAMLLQLVALKAAVETLKYTKSENENITAIQSEVGKFVEALLVAKNDQPSVIQQLIKIVPNELIKDTLRLARIGGETISTAAIELKIKVAGGENALQLLEQLGLKESMLKAAFTDTPLQPLEDFFTTQLNTLKPQETQPAPTPSTPQKTYKNDIVKKAHVALVEGIDQKVKDIVKNHPDVLSLAMDKNIIAKLNKLKNLQKKVGSFLGAVDDYLNQSAFNPSVSQLTEIMKQLVELEAAMKALYPEPNKPLSAAEQVVQQGMNDFVSALLKEDSVIFELITELNKSYILSSALTAMSLADNPQLTRTGSVAKILDFTTIPKQTVGELNPLIEQVQKTSLPKHIKGQSSSSDQILSGYFREILGGMKSVPPAQTQAWEKTINDVTLNELASALAKKAATHSEYKNLSDHVLQLDNLLCTRSVSTQYSEEAREIKQQTVTFILTHVDVTIEGITKPQPQKNIHAATTAYKNSIAIELKKIDAPGLMVKIGMAIGAIIGGVIGLFSLKNPIASIPKGAATGAATVHGLVTAPWWRHHSAPTTATTDKISETVNKISPPSSPK